MFPESIFIPSSMWSPGDARDSSRVRLQVASKLEGRQRDEQENPQCEKCLGPHGK